MDLRLHRAGLGRGHYQVGTSSLRLSGKTIHREWRFLIDATMHPEWVEQHGELLRLRFPRRADAMQYLEAYLGEEVELPQVPRSDSVKLTRISAGEYEVLGPDGLAWATVSTSDRRYWKVRLVGTAFIYPARTLYQAERLLEGINPSLYPAAADPDT